jgi:hypothetical protein
VRFAYADPPYPGRANLYPERTEVDHAELIARLDADYDGWALSTHVPGLPIVVPLLPERARVCAWVKPWARMHPGARLQYAWEPVILAPVRKPTRSVVDWIACNATRGRGLVGAKPDGLCYWLFAAAGLRPDDELVDVYPGTGAVTRAWERWRAQRPLGLGETTSARRRRTISLDL